MSTTNLHCKAGLAGVQQCLPMGEVGKTMGEVGKTLSRAEPYRVSTTNLHGEESLALLSVGAVALKHSLRAKPARMQARG